MKTIGLIGGLSWQSTQTYYNTINNEVNFKMGKNHSARILMYSFDFEEIEALQNRSDWDKLNSLMSDAGRRLEKAGADCLLICSNTMHECSDHLLQTVGIPLLHITDAVGQILNRDNVRKAGLLGTKFLMQSDTYVKKLKDQYQVDVVIPMKDQIELINDIIYSELVKGIIIDNSRKEILSVIQGLVNNNSIEAIILGCTEIPLLIKQDDCSIPVFDTTDIHAKSAADYATCS